MKQACSLEGDTDIKQLNKEFIAEGDTYHEKSDSVGQGADWRGHFRSLGNLSEGTFKLDEEARREGKGRTFHKEETACGKVCAQE